MLQEKTGGISGMFKRSPKPAPRSLVAKVIITIASLYAGLFIWSPDIRNTKGKSDFCRFEHDLSSDMPLFKTLTA